MQKKFGMILVMGLLVAAGGWVLLRVLGGSTSEPGIGQRQCPPDCNVILISIDTLRADHLGTYGYHRKTSPFIDRFAEGSVVFENAISQSAWTTPAHASMMTGLHPHDHGLVYYSNPGRISPETITLAEVLVSRGYRSVGFNGGGYVSAEFGLDQGFEIYRGTRQIGPNIEASIEWLDQNDGAPFFLFLHGFDVHRPYDVALQQNPFTDYQPDFDIRIFCNAEMKQVKDQEQLDFIVSQYDAGILYTDALLGGFFEYLEKEGHLEDTVVIITSDHGDEFYEHGDCDHIKSVYDELIHVPLIVFVPGVKPLRVKSQVPASVSLYPTVLELLDIQAGQDGTNSLTELLQGRSRTFPHVLSETGFHRAQKFWRSVRTEAWKMILISHFTEGPSFELYHLAEDRGEQHDLFEASPAEAEILLSHLVKPGIPGARGSDQLDVSDETEARLRTLGYIED